MSINELTTTPAVYDKPQKAELSILKSVDFLGSDFENVNQDLLQLLFYSVKPKIV